MNFSLSKPKRCSGIILGCLPVVVLILIVNAWNVSCVHCQVVSLLQIPGLGWALIGANLIAGCVLLMTHRYHKNKTPENCCASCVATLYERWEYCPKCGVARR